MAREPQPILTTDNGRYTVGRARLGAGEEHHRLCDILGRRSNSERNRAAHRLTQFVGAFFALALSHHGESI